MLTISALARRAALLSVAAVAAATLGVPAANAMPIPETTGGAAAFDTPQTIAGTDHDDRDRVRPRPTVTFEQRCERRLCFIRVLIDDGRTLWSCRPGVRHSSRGRDDDLQALDIDSVLRTAGRGRGDDDDGDWWDDDDDVLRPVTTRLRLRCVPTDR